MAYVFDEGLAIADQRRGARGRGAGQDIRSSNPLLFHGGQSTSEHGRGDQGTGGAQVQGQLAHPFAGPFGAGHVQYAIDQVALAQGIFDAEDVPRDFDQVALQLAAIPIIEDLVEFAVA